MRTLNIRLAAILAGSAVALLVGAYFLHHYQMLRNADIFKREAEIAQERATQAAKEKNVKAEKEAHDDAMRNLGWYVRLVPSDTDSLEKLALLLADQIVDNRTFSDAWSCLERVLRQDPDRPKTRRRAVDLAIMARRFRDAKEHLEVLLQQTPTDGALWELLGRCNAETGSYSAATANLKKSIEVAPANVEAYPPLAAMLRKQSAKTKEADQLMQQLVATNPKSARAHFLRGAYLKGIDANKEALGEALKSLELTADNRDALLLAAQCYIAQKEFDKARERAARGIELYPKDVEMYGALCDVELAAQNRDKAIAVVQQGLKATQRRPQLLWRMTSLLIDDNKLTEAEGTIAELRRTDLPKQLIAYLTARIELVRGHWLAARQGFEEARPALTNWPVLLKQVDVWIGQCYGKARNHDQELAAYRRALDIDRSYVPALVGLTDALMAHGKVDEALKMYGELAKTGKLSPADMIPQVYMLIVQNLKKPSAEQDWSTAEKMLDQIEKTNPGIVQIPILRAQILTQQNRFADAEQLLKNALSKNPKQNELRAALVRLAQRSNDPKELKALLDEWEKSSGDTVQRRLAQAQVAAGQEGAKAMETLRKLAENTDRFSDAERLQLWNGLLAEAMRVGDAQQVRQLGQQIAEKEPNNVQVRYVMFDQALRANDEPGMEQALKEVERVAGQDAFWHYGQAVLLTLHAKDDPSGGQMLDKAIRQLNLARELHPTWSRLPLLAASIYEQQGRGELALAEYLKAVELGDRNPGAVRKTIRLLFQRQRYSEVDRLLRELEEQQVPFTPEMHRASTEIALQQGQFDRALERARKVTSPDSKNYGEHIWLGKVLNIIGYRAKLDGRTKEAAALLAEAEKSLRRAVEIEPTIAETWVALVEFLSATEAEDATEKAIEEAATKIPAKQRALALAQCYEAMKKKETAQDNYEEALSAAPDDPPTVRAVADFYRRIGKVKLAEPLLVRIIDKEVRASDDDVVWARRQLAVILANRGGYQNSQDARELIDKNLAAPEVSAADRRVRASLDASAPERSRRDDAIRMIEGMIQDQTALPDDRFELAQMYVAVGAWERANGLFRSLVTSYPNEAKYAVPYIAALLEQNQVSSAETQLEHLEKIYPNQMLTVGLRAELLVAKNEADKAFELLKGFIDKSGAQPPERELRVRLTAEKLELLANRLRKRSQGTMADLFLEHAESLYRSFVARNSGLDWLMVAFLARQGRIDEGLDVLDRMWDTHSPTVLTQLCALFLQDGVMGTEQMQRLGQVLQKAIAQYERPLPLLILLADLYGQYGRYPDAEKLYREVLKKNVGNVQATNNLAVLLALQGIKLDESLALVNRAIEIAGPMGPLLDSRAMVYMALGDMDKAMKDLRDALANEETAVRLFHQAQAFEKAGQTSAATVTLEKAVKKGLVKQTLHPLERPILERLERLSQPAKPSTSQKK